MERSIDVTLDCYVELIEWGVFLKEIMLGSWWYYNSWAEIQISGRLKTNRHMNEQCFTFLFIFSLRH